MLPTELQRIVGKKLKGHIACIKSVGLGKSVNFEMQKLECTRNGTGVKGGEPRMSANWRLVYFALEREETRRYVLDIVGICLGDVFDRLPFPAVLPYINRNLKKIGKKHGVEVAFTVPNKLCELVQRQNKSGEHISQDNTQHRVSFIECSVSVVYRIPFACGTVYVGQQGCCLNTRLREHWSSRSSCRRLRMDPYFPRYYRAPASKRDNISRASRSLLYSFDRQPNLHPFALTIFA